MTELVGLLLRAEGDETPPALHDGYGAARLQLIQAQVLKRLGDDDLTILSAARRAGLTPKQVQRLFGATGVSLSDSFSNSACCSRIVCSLAPAGGETYHFPYIKGWILKNIFELAGDDLTRENIIKVATSMPKTSVPLMLPGVTIEGTPELKTMRIVRFDGKSWVPITEAMTAGQ